MPEDGLVTTIIPVYNRAAMLAEAVGSVLAQTYRPLEIVIVDDGSTDDTPRAADALAREHPEQVRVVHQANAGVALAREAGRPLARGEFVQHLDSDDLLLSRKFELQVAGLRAHPECGASYGWTRWRYADGRMDEGPAKRSGQRIETMFPAMLQARIWDTPAPLYRRALIDAAGAWLPLRVEEDWEYDARIAAQGVRLHFVDDWVCEVRRHREGHLSSQATALALRDRAAAHERILRHAQRAGIGSGAPEMQHFARELFLLARQCGAAGLPRQSRALFELAREASGPAASRPALRLYRAAAALVGWSAAGKIATLADRWRW